jgi:hypothetical protein
MSGAILESVPLMSAAKRCRQYSSGDSWGRERNSDEKMGPDRPGRGRFGSTGKLFAAVKACEAPERVSVRKQAIGGAAFYNGFVGDARENRWFG